MQVAPCQQLCGCCRTTPRARYPAHRPGRVVERHIDVLLGDQEAHLSLAVELGDDLENLLRRSSAPDPSTAHRAAPGSDGSSTPGRWRPSAARHRRSARRGCGAWSSAAGTRRRCAPDPRQSRRLRPPHKAAAAQVVLDGELRRNTCRPSSTWHHAPAHPLAGIDAGQVSGLRSRSATADFARARPAPARKSP